jgi:hypothetical protein
MRLSRLLERFACGFKPHDWRLDHGKVDALSFALCVAAGVGPEVRTYSVRTPDGGMEIWGWTCRRCGRVRPATEEDAIGARIVSTCSGASLSDNHHSDAGLSFTGASNSNLNRRLDGAKGPVYISKYTIPNAKNEQEKP